MDLGRSFPRGHLLSLKGNVAGQFWPTPSRGEVHLEYLLSFPWMVWLRWCDSILKTSWSQNSTFISLKKTAFSRLQVHQFYRNLPTNNPDFKENMSCSGDTTAIFRWFLCDVTDSCLCDWLGRLPKPPQRDITGACMGPLVTFSRITGTTLNANLYISPLTTLFLVLVHITSLWREI